MKTFRNTKLISLIWFLGELITFLVLYFYSSNKVLSTTFFALTAAGLFIILCTWGSFKILNSQIRRNAVKKSSTDKTMMKIYAPNILADEKGRFKDKDIISIKRKRGFSVILMCLIPTLFALIISLVFAL